MRIKKNKQQYLSNLDDVDLGNCARCLIDSIDDLVKCVAECPADAIKLMEEQNRNLRTDTPPGDSDQRLTA